MKTVALFDLDKTLIRGNCSYLFGRYLHRHGHLPTLSALFCVGCYLSHTYGMLSLEGLHTQVFRHLFHGKPAEHYKTLAAQFFDHSYPDILYTPAYERLLNAKKQGHYTAILSSSPDFMVAHFAKKFEVDHHSGTAYNIDENGRFHSIGTIMDGPLKKSIAAGIAQQVGIPLNQHHFYTDSILDLPLMESVGKPVAVNPDSLLRRISLTQKWEII